MLNVPADPVFAAWLIRERGERGENFDSREVVVSNGLGTGGGEEAIHLWVELGMGRCVW